jgi:hypothetical protein
VGLKKLFLAVLSKNPPIVFFEGKKLVSAKYEKSRFTFKVKKKCIFLEKRLTSDFPILVHVCNFFRTKWVNVLSTKQRLRVFKDEK